MELDHFKPFPFIKFQNFLQPWLPRIFGNKSPGVEFKSVGVRVKSVGVEFEILLTCLGCGYAMLFKLADMVADKKSVLRAYPNGNKSSRAFYGFVISRVV